MDTKILLDKQGKEEIKNMFKWLKRFKKNVDAPDITYNIHCDNYASHCCLSCDKCWGGRYKTKK